MTFSGNRCILEVLDRWFFQEYKLKSTIWYVHAFSVPTRLRNVSARLIMYI